VFRISGITKTGADATYIPQEDGSRGPTVAAYFSERYKALQYPSMPCVRIGPLAKHNYLPVRDTSTAIIVLLLLFYYCHCYETVDTIVRINSSSNATTHYGTRL
jgi:hypothetical protein